MKSAIVPKKADQFSLAKLRGPKQREPMGSSGVSTLAKTADGHGSNDVRIDAIMTPHGTGAGKGAAPL